VLYKEPSVDWVMMNGSCIYTLRTGKTVIRPEQWRIRDPGLDGAFCLNAVSGVSRSTL
jgi:hypothetical protein